jgi:hypothetical protein
MIAAATTAAMAARMVRIEPVFTGCAQLACSRTAPPAATAEAQCPSNRGA